MGFDPLFDETRRGLRRRVFLRPGFVCGKVNCCVGEAHAGPSRHGIGCNELVFVLSAVDGSFAVSFMLFTGVYPEACRLVPTPASGASVSSHSLAPFDGDTDSFRTKDTSECAYLDGGCCYSGRDTALLGGVLWRDATAGSTPEACMQPGGFPRVFDALYTQAYQPWREAFDATRVDRAHVICPHCDGKGLLPVLPNAPAEGDA